MSNVTVSTAVALAELRAKAEWLETRCLMLRQAVQDSEEETAARRKQIEELQAAAKPAEEGE